KKRRRRPSLAAVSLRPASAWPSRRSISHLGSKIDHGRRRPQIKLWRWERHRDSSASIVGSRWSMRRPSRSPLAHRTARVQWCWRCRADVPMLDDDEHARVWAAYQRSRQTVSETINEAVRVVGRTSIIPDPGSIPGEAIFSPVVDEYARIT